MPVCGVRVLAGKSPGGLQRAFGGDIPGRQCVQRAEFHEQHHTQQQTEQLRHRLHPRPPLIQVGQFWMRLYFVIALPFLQKRLELFKLGRVDRRRFDCRLFFIGQDMDA